MVSEFSMTIPHIDVVWKLSAPRISCQGVTYRRLSLISRGPRLTSPGL